MNSRIQNIVFPLTDDMELNYELFYRGSKGVYKRDERKVSFADSTWVDFSTYVNGCSYLKWRKYTDIKGLELVLDIVGKCEVLLVGYTLNVYNPERTIVGRYDINNANRSKVEFKFETTEEYNMFGFELNCLENVTLFGGYYVGEFEREKPREVVLSIGTTTCNKEKFIKRNIQLIKNEIFDKNDEQEIKDNLYVHVVDNGRTLDVDEMKSWHINVHPNKNTGGSGGFARGMIESIKQSPKATHVLLMDDDVVVLPESIKRTYRLFSFVNDEYKDALISGAMLYLEDVSMQHEDVGNISIHGNLGPLKETLQQTSLQDNLINELPAYGSPYTYAGWWFCGIPVAQIEKNGLPMPFFIRIDDVEYGRRLNAKIMTMNGIGIWHMGFFNKFNLAMDIYQQCRNTLIAQAIGSLDESIRAFDHVKSEYLSMLLKFNYNAAQLAVEALEDYLKGPEWLEHDLGEKLLKEHSELNEKFISLSELKGEEWVLPDLWDDPQRSFIEKWWYRITCNGHRFWPEKWLKNEPEHIMFNDTYTPKKYCRRRVLYAINPDLKVAAIRTIDKKRYRELQNRYKNAIKAYKEHNEEIKNAYLNKKEYLTSMEFWEKYLDI